MSEISAIEWLHSLGPDGRRHPGSTYNHWSGCDHVSGGCDHCYAMLSPPSMRRGALWGPDELRVHCGPDYPAQPHRWNEKAAALGVRTRVFTASMSDVFEARDDLDEWRAELFQIIGRTPSLDWLVLTKRPQEIMARIPGHWRGQLPGQVWIGTSIESRPTARQRLRHLVEVPASVRFVSAEPLLEDITDELLPYLQARQVHWVIAGGESKAGARPANPEWFRRLRDACSSTGTAFFFKQWGEWAPELDFDPEMAGRCQAHRETGMETMLKVGKKKAGRLLDDRTHDDAPRAAFGAAW